MLEFRNYIFIDEELVESFAGQIGIEFNDSEISESVQKTGTVKGGVPMIAGAGEFSSENTRHEIVRPSAQSKLQRFEHELIGRNGLVELGKLAAPAPQIGSIVKLRGAMSVPEAFDNIGAFSDFLPFMSSGFVKEEIVKSSDNSTGVSIDALLSLLSKGAATFPFAIDAVGCTAIVEISADRLAKSNELSELVEDDISVLGQVVKACGIDESLEFCNMCKLLGIGRSARRSMKKEQQGIETIQGPAIRIKPLAVWQ